MSNDICQIYHVDKERVASSKARMPDEQTVVALAETFKILAEPTRIRILHAISEEELCVCDIAAVVNATQSAISHQLRILRSARLVKFRKAGKMAYYSLDDEHVQNLFEEGIRHMQED